jgi:hypothetical protein
MKDFKIVQDHFKKLRCAHCQEGFQPDGVALVREDQEYWVVHVHCVACKQPAGTAIVGVDYDERRSPMPPPPEPSKVNQLPPSPKAKARTTRDPIFNSKAESDKFSGMSKITMDDVSDARAFIQALGADWMRHIPRR